MPCPNCNAPDIQNAQANYCFYCGYLFNPALKNKGEKNEKVLNIFAIIFGLHIFTSILYAVLPLLLNARSFGSSGSFSYITILKFTGIFFGIADVTLLFLVSAFLKQNNLKVLFMVYAILHLVLMLVNTIRWIL